MVQVPGNNQAGVRCMSLHTIRTVYSLVSGLVSGSAIFWFRLVPRFFGFLGWAVFGFAGDSVLV